MKRHKASDKRKVAIDLEIAEQLKAIPSPTFIDILPLAIVRGTFNFIISIPALCAAAWGCVRQEVEKVKKEKEEQKGTIILILPNSFSSVEIKKEQEERLQRKEQKKKQKSQQQRAPREPTFEELTPSIYQLSNLVISNDEVSEKDQETTGFEQHGARMMKLCSFV